jgi:eukaryotic-like serine/threonine-protein kinase
VYFDLSESASAIAAYKKAYDLRETVSERERFNIDSCYYRAVTGELDKAIQVLLQWEHTYQHDASPHADLGLVLAILGQHERDLEEQKQAIKLDPDTTFYYGNLALAYLNLNQFDKAHNVVHEMEARKMPPWITIDLLYSLAFLRGDTAAMQSQLTTAMNQPEFEGILLSLQADTEAYFGRLEKAREYSAKASASARATNDFELAAGYAVTMALHEAEFGYAAQAQQDVATALASHPGQMGQTLAALALALAGDTKRASKLSSELNRQFPLDTMMNSYWLPTIRAVIEMDRKNSLQAVTLLQATASYELGTPQTPTNAVLYPIYVRGLAFLATGKGNEARSEFQKIVDHPGIISNFPLGALARLGIARSLAMEASAPPIDNAHTASSDRIREVRAAYETFFALWKDADRDLPILKQARKEYEALEAPAGNPHARAANISRAPIRRRVG